MFGQSVGDLERVGIRFLLPSGLEESLRKIEIEIGEEKIKKVKMLPTKDILLVLAVLSAGSSLVDGRVHGGGGSEIRKKHRTEHLHHLQE